ncbi:hypothetical protein FEM48_Zijuj05G0183600 [Ziziphus jujuba var. spinosa]|uniref:Uncharacterized protein n=1 Tax=Ziziphus jujuba var. spinosa TaxID=714518 RepID=A0A978VGE5_ZIZJJ|nr:hypothetical protein FEM48_Zijuj05G0183600 [Ziziphus jujuba var. spinosa]
MEGVSMKLEEAFCLFLLGEVCSSFTPTISYVTASVKYIRNVSVLAGNKAEVVEKVQQFELNSNPAVLNSVPGKDVKDAFG